MSCVLVNNKSQTGIVDGSQKVLYRTEYYIVSNCQ